MTQRLPRSLKGYTVWVDGYGYAGRLSGAKLPVVKAKTEAYRDGGMDGETDLEFGVEKLEYGLTFSELDANLLALALRRGAGITIRGSIEGEGPNAAKTPLVAELRGLNTEADPGEWGDPKKSEVKINGTADYYRLRINGREVYEIDILNLIRRIDGVDQLAERRRNLGL